MNKSRGNDDANQHEDGNGVQIATPPVSVASSTASETHAQSSNLRISVLQSARDRTRNFKIGSLLPWRSSAWALATLTRHAICRSPQTKINKRFIF
jgi:hypothetical protein